MTLLLTVTVLKLIACVALGLWCALAVAGTYEIGRSR